MKRYFYTYFISGFLCFSSLFAHANTCAPEVFQKQEQFSVHLEELNDPRLDIQTGVYIGIPLPVLKYYPDTIFQFTNLTYGYIPGKILTRVLSRRDGLNKIGDVRYSSHYVSEEKSLDKGKYILLFELNFGGLNQIYRHFIIWPSDKRDIRLRESVIKQLFNRMYERAYGRNLDWMIKNHVILKTLFYAMKNFHFPVHKFYYYDPFAVEDIFNFDSLLFRDEGWIHDRESLRLFVSEAIKNPQSADSPKTSSARLTSWMERSIRMVTLREAQGEIKKEAMEAMFREQWNRKLRETEGPVKGPLEGLDISLFHPEDIVYFLTRTDNNYFWRERIPMDQVRQIDVSAPGIQYVFAPFFKHFDESNYSSFKKRDPVNIDALSDEQIMRFDRDTFLRDVFLAGDLYVRDEAPLNSVVARKFVMVRKEKVDELGYEVVMKGSLRKEVHDFILRKLGFDTDFELMTPEQRREVFKKEIEMMMNTSKQVEIINDLVSFLQLIHPAQFLEI